MRIPPGKDPAGESCFARCSAGARLGDQERFACVAACPGAIKADDDCVVPDQPGRPLPLCVRMEKSNVGPALVVVGVLLLAAGAGLALLLLWADTFAHS